MPRRTATRPLAALLAAVLVTAAVSASGHEELLLVGVVSGGREVGTLEVLRQEQSFWLPLLPLADLLSFEVASEGDGTLRIETPLGDARVPPQAQLLVSGTTYVSQDWLVEHLSLSLSFDAEEFAFLVEPPWRGDEQTRSRQRVDLSPDVEAPGWSLSTWRQDLLYVADGPHRRAYSSTVLTGRAADGAWRLRYEDDLEGSPRMREYGWLRIEGRNLLLAGQQTVSLHPLLDAMELTGVQMAWTNQPLDLFARSLRPGELLPRAVQPVSTFRGPAPPGTIAELRIDGMVVERRTVSLQGRYEFLDVTLPTRQISRVEVRIFDRDNPYVPIAIHEERLRTSKLLLPAGAVIHMGGLGEEGNLVDRSLRAATESADPSGFYQFRHGLSKDWTLEAAVQRWRGSNVLEAGFVSTVVPGFVLDLGLSASEAGLGYSVELAGRRGYWDVLARLYEQSHRDAASGLVDHVAEVEYARSSRIRASVLARMRRDASDETHFVLPALTWRPGRRFTLRARPDLEGEYRLDASLLLAPSARLALFHEVTTGVDLTLSLTSRHRLSVRGETGGGSSALVSQITRLGRGPKSPTLSAGVVLNDGEEGLLVSGDVPIGNGLLARFEAQSVPISARGGEPLEPRLLISLTADLGVVGRRLISADTFGVSGRRGAVAGRLRLRGAGRDVGLDSLPVLVDGRLRSRTDREGAFFVGGLEEGVHLLEIDAENLPIELVLEERTLLVEVANGAVSRVALFARHEYGVAGQLIDAAGEGMPGVRIDLLDADRRRLDTCLSDRFGFYRFDGVPSGRYSLRAISGDPAAPKALTERPLEVTDDFLFGQDLHLPTP